MPQPGRPQEGVVSVGNQRTPDTGSRSGRKCSWCIVRDKETGQLLCVEPTSQPSYSVTKRYEILGFLNEPEDAVQFIQFKELDAPCDSLAYLQVNREVQLEPEKFRKVDTEELQALCDKVRTSTGRTCFGYCQSEDGATACGICYTDLHDTWHLCAIIQSILEGKERLKKQDANAQEEQQP